MASTPGTLFQWIDDPPHDRAIHVASPDWEWHACSYQVLADRTRAAAAGLARIGVAHNDVVAIVLAPGPSLIAAIFGTMCAGATPLIVAPPRVFGPGDYAAHLLHVTATAAAASIVTSAALAGTLAETPGLAMPIRTIDAIVEAGAGADRPARPLADLALLQFTSGTQGPSRGVRVPHASLVANVTAIRQWLDWTGEDAAAFWTPPYHDMGLIGGLFAPLASRCDLWYLTPEQFVRRPIEYLRTFGRRGARFTAIPAFGLDHILRRVRPADLDGCDFSAVKGIIVGAELISPVTLERMAALLEPRGLRSGVLLPAYGLAESTLAVTGVSPGEPWSVAAPPGGGPPVVGCGRPLDQGTIGILDEDGDAVGDGQAGEIVVRGPSVAAGYVAARPSTRWVGDVLHTGDAGFMADGQLFPIGRQGDSLKIRGQSLFAEWLEREVERRGRPRHHNTVLLGVHQGRPAVVWIAEGPATDESDRDVCRALSRMADGADVLHVRAARGTIVRTSSGKPRRQQLWNDFINNRLRGTGCGDPTKEEQGDVNRCHHAGW
jgi:acyl-CoA synthetase (AMP-forming)/AMP-acid ligase II